MNSKKEEEPEVSPMGVKKRVRIRLKKGFWKEHGYYQIGLFSAQVLS